MAVKEITKVDQNANFIELRFDNGDFTKLNDVIKKWNFKDYQSFFRFTVSIMLVSEDNFMSIAVDGEPKSIKPSPEFLNNEQI